MVKLVDIKPRLYQETIFSTAVKYNTLVVLPTGLGKTTIAIMLAIHRLKNYPKSKIIIVAPTKPLAEQLANAFRDHLEFNDIISDNKKESIVVLTGHTKPEKRKELYKRSKIIACTPQTIENDILNRIIDLKDVSLLIFDECHRAVGSYSYVWLAKQYNAQAQYPRILGLTASPGSNLEKIDEVIRNLYIEKIEIRTLKDKDVQPYIKAIQTKWIKVKLDDEMLVIRDKLKNIILSGLKKLYNYQYLNYLPNKDFSKSELLGLQQKIQEEVIEGNRSGSTHQALSIVAQIIKVEHAVELIETQGVVPLYYYLQKIREEGLRGKTKATKNLIESPIFKEVYLKTMSLIEQEKDHPKLEKLVKIINEINKKEIKIIVFTQFRDSAERIVERLNTLKDVKAVMFVGQAKKRGHGLTQKKQIELLEQFKDGMFNVLVATSVAEEGLDISSVDYVIFYEPVPSAIRHIQRRGRTGRQEMGNLIVLITEKTRDESYRWSAYHKEKRMIRLLNKLKEQYRDKINVSEKIFGEGTKGINKKNNALSINTKKQKNKDITIFVDHREKGEVIRILYDKEINIQLCSLDVGDYLLSSRVIAEYKKINDFIDSIIDGRLLTQARLLKRNYESPLFIVEGDLKKLYSLRNINSNAIRGAILTINTIYNIPIIWTKNEFDSAEFLYQIAKREQLVDHNININLHINKPRTLKEAQEYVVSSLPNIGYKLSKPLLRYFGSIKNIINASIDELKQVELIGEKKARSIKEIVEADYDIEGKKKLE